MSYLKLFWVLSSKSGVRFTLTAHLTLATFQVRVATRPEATAERAGTTTRNLYTVFGL